MVCNWWLDGAIFLGSCNGTLVFTIRKTKMLLYESTTSTGKVIAFSDNGILSIKQESEINYGRLTKDQAIALSKTIMTWAVKQPDPNPALGQASRWSYGVAVASIPSYPSPERQQRHCSEYKIKAPQLSLRGFYPVLQKQALLSVMTGLFSLIKTGFPGGERLSCVLHNQKDRQLFFWADGQVWMLLHLEHYSSLREEWGRLESLLAITPTNIRRPGWIGRKILDVMICGKRDESRHLPPGNPIVQRWCRRSWWRRFPIG